MKHKLHILYPLHLVKLQKKKLVANQENAYSLHYISVFYVERGSVCFRIGKKEVTIHAGHGFFFPKQQQLSLYASEDSDYYFLAVKATDMSLCPLNAGPFFTPDKEELDRVFFELHHTAKASPRFSLAVSVALYRFFATLSQITHSLSLDEKKKEAELKCIPAIEYIQQNLSKDTEVGKLASLCGYGVTHFSRLFRTATGSTTKEYIRKLRMQTAVQILTDVPNITTQEIAKMLGYEYRYFLILFRRTYGIAPDSYRKKKR